MIDISEKTNDIGSDSPKGLYRKPEAQPKKTLSEISSTIGRYIPELRKNKPLAFENLGKLLTDATQMLERSNFISDEDLYGTLPRIQKQLDTILVVAEANNETFFTLVNNTKVIIDTIIQENSYKRN